MAVPLAMSHLIFLGLDFGPKGDVALYQYSVHICPIQPQLKSFWLKSEHKLLIHKQFEDSKAQCMVILS